MSFKHFFESVEPTKPSSSIDRRNITKNPGTMKASSAVEYRFKTKLGNVVKVHFEPKYDDTYNVLFYVNDTLSDDASKKDGSPRDKEILPSVLYVIKKKADQLQAKSLTFEAFKGEGDNRTLKDVDVKPYQEKALLELNRFLKILQAYPVTMIPPSPDRIALFKKFNKGIPEPLADLDTPVLIKHIIDLKSNIENINDTLINAIHQFLEIFLRVDWLKFNIQIEPLRLSLRNLEGSIRSNTEQGWTVTKNRREAVYDKLMNRYFSDGWDIAKRNSHFTLTRKIS